MSDLADELIAADKTAPVVHHTHHQQRRWILVLLLLGLGATILLSVLAGSAQTFALLLNANLLFVALVVVMQGLRYVPMAISTITVAGIVKARVPFGRMMQVTLTAQTANRTFVGGAAGFLIRLAFFLKRGMHSGTFTGVEAVEDGASLIAVALLFLSGLGIVLASGAASGFRWDVIGAVIVVALLLAAAVVALVRRRPLVEALADGLAGTVSRLVARVSHRNLYDPARVRGAVADFYFALSLARRSPLRVLVSFFCALGRLGCDAAALFFAFQALGYNAAPGTVLLIFVVSSSVSTLAAVPGQVGVMETSLSLMSSALGIPGPVAVGATLLYRLVSFWLPIPFGYAFAWDLQRNDLL